MLILAGLAVVEGIICLALLRMARHARHEMKAAQAAALESARAAALAAPGAIDPEAVLALLRQGHAPTLDNVYAMMRRREREGAGQVRRVRAPGRAGPRQRRPRRASRPGARPEAPTSLTSSAGRRAAPPVRALSGRLPRVAAPLERGGTSPAAGLGRREERHGDRLLAKLRDRLLGSVQHGNAVANGPAGPTGDLRRKQLLTRRCAPTSSAARRSWRSSHRWAASRDAAPRRGHPARCDLDEDRVALGDPRSSTLPARRSPPWGSTSMRVVPASANSAAARSSPESKALPSPNHSSSWIEAPPAVAIVPVLITAS